MNNIKDNSRKLMTPTTIFYSSKAMMELLEDKKFVINSEVNVNIDKSFLKFSLNDISVLSTELDFIMKDLQKFNNEASK
jgi:hypothetical protein